MMSYQGKRAAVVGLARSGTAAARLLEELGADVSVSEKNDTPKLRESAVLLEKSGVRVELGGHSRSFIKGRDFVVTSPGVPPAAEPLVWAREENIEVISEIELAARVCPAPIIAVTGTNGKTTTTTLIGEVIKARGWRAHVLGNIGTPFSSAVLDIKREDFAVLEISSFQLETVKSFHPHVAVMLNLTPDHLDRYASMEEYLGAKKRIFLNQTAEDYLVLNHGDSYLRDIAPACSQRRACRPRIVFFNTGEDAGGDFNQNQMAVLAVAGVLGIPRDVVLTVLANFKGVEHRMEFVRSLDGVDFINDSKATNIDSTVWALKNIKKPAVLIAGGRDKGSDFGSLACLVKEKVRAAVLVGEAGERIETAWKTVVPCERAASFEAALAAARRRAQGGDIVLFSPMCKSFDMFTDYEHRGRTFKELVNRLI